MSNMNYWFPDKNDKRALFNIYLAGFLVLFSFLFFMFFFLLPDKTKNQLNLLPILIYIILAVAIPILLVKYGKLCNPFIEGAAFVMMVPIMTIDVLLYNVMLSQGKSLYEYKGFLVFIFILSGTLTRYLYLSKHKK